MVPLIFTSKQCPIKRQSFWFQEESLWWRSVDWCYLKYLRIFYHEGDLRQYENNHQVLKYYFQCLEFHSYRINCEEGSDTKFQHLHCSCKLD